MSENESMPAHEKSWSDRELLASILSRYCVVLEDLGGRTPTFLVSEKKEVEGYDFVKEFVDDMVTYWDDNLTKLFRKKRDIQIADAVIELFKRRSDLENFNKKALYIMIREMTDVKTQHITKVVNQMKSHYLKISENYYETGSFSGRKIDISQIL